ncbi:MAG: hypothetical protein IPI19_18880 [Ignavibacteriales bacterium]|nr:hypothetical protein [Ignavibacteriales bacterium]
MANFIAMFCFSKWQGFTVTEKFLLNITSADTAKQNLVFRDSLKAFIDLITVTFVGRYVKRPMHLFGFLGVLSFFVRPTVNGYLNTKWLSGKPLSNRPMLFLGMLLIIVGAVFLQLVCLVKCLLLIRTRVEREYVVKDQN